MSIKTILPLDILISCAIPLTIEFIQRIYESIAYPWTRKQREKDAYYDQLLFYWLDLYSRNPFLSNIHRCRSDQIDLPYLLYRTHYTLTYHQQESIMFDVTPSTYPLFCQAKKTLIMQYHDMNQLAIGNRDDTDDLLTSYKIKQQTVQSILSTLLPDDLCSVVQSFCDTDELYRIYQWSGRMSYLIIYIDDYNQTVVHYIKM